MLSIQQEQTLDYFRRQADDWQRKSLGQVQKYNVINGRNSAALRFLAGEGQPGRMIDLGCGTGQLTIDAARQGWTAEGVDFSAEMIEHCQRNRAEAGVDAVFSTTSIFDIPTPPAQPYDAVSAQGLIEYVAPAELDRLFAKTADMLRPGGAFIVGSRNRLFNLFSLNDFTRMERDMGHVPALLDEALVFAGAASPLAALEAAEQIAPEYAHPDAHPHTTGIEVSVRYQYTPGDLTRRLRRHGFIPQTIYPVHYHALPTGLKDVGVGLHVAFAETMDAAFPNDQRLIPQSSTFVLAVRKA